MTQPLRRRPENEHLARGALGEALAARHLEAQGFTLLARDLRTKLAELDLVLRKGRLLVVVEVKTRSDHAAPERFVDARRYERLRRATQALARVLDWRPADCRVDVVAVRILKPGAEHEIVHFPGVPVRVR